MSRVASAVVGAASMAAEAAGIPGVSIAASVLEQFMQQCEEVKGHEVGSILEVIRVRSSAETQGRLITGAMSSASR